MTRSSVRNGARTAAVAAATLAMITSFGLFTTSTSAAADPATDETATSCGAWKIKKGPVKNEDGDGNVALQVASCHSGGSWRAYVRTRVCNVKAGGKSQFQPQLYRDGNQRLYIDTLSWPKVGKCHWSRGFRAYKGHDYTAGLSTYYTDGGNDFVSTSPWHYS